jgi:DNA adenine methylase
MHYLGSKARHADQILEHVLRDRKPGQWYVEPFVGGGNVLCRVPQEQGPRLAADFNPFMVAVLKRLSEGWEPRATITRPEYEALRDHYDANKFKPGFFSEDEMADIAAIALGASFGSLWFGSWANDPPDRPGMRWGQGRAAALRDAPGLRGAKFVCASFDKLFEVARDAGYAIPDGSLIYCDPPYRDTTGYDGAVQQIKVGESAGLNEWKPSIFWKWADDLVDQGHTVFVSEYSGPTTDQYKVEAPAGYAEAVAEAGELEQLIKRLETPDPNDSFWQPPDELPSLYEKQTNLRHAIGIHDGFIAGRRKALCDRWQVVWKKAVKVNVASQDDTQSDRAELLMTRSPD